ncbi:MAG TPA: hypothetical protein DDZ68_09115 [Parvularcula sp.]|nr:hypothetical protein [Parvularcula sp.]HBS33218.1 hypothetical protein [Parvularcula sp.]HBS35596.1 hypothetical protein [Parvularcula sp.]
MELTIAKRQKTRKLAPHEIDLICGGSDVDYTILGYSADGSQAFVMRTERFSDGNIDITYSWMDSVTVPGKRAMPAIHAG